MIDVGLVDELLAVEGEEDGGEKEKSHNRAQHQSDREQQNCRMRRFSTFELLLTFVGPLKPLIAYREIHLIE